MGPGASTVGRTRVVNSVALGHCDYEQVFVVAMAEMTIRVQGMNGITRGASFLGGTGRVADHFLGICDVGFETRPTKAFRHVVRC